MNQSTLRFRPLVSNVPALRSYPDSFFQLQKKYVKYAVRAKSIFD